MNTFSDLKIETLKDMKKELASELENKSLPKHLKNEVLSYLYYVDEELRYKENLSKF